MNPYESGAEPTSKPKYSLIAIVSVIAGMVVMFALGYSLGYLDGFMYSRNWDGPPVRINKD